jgi:hypothetical protein
LRPIGGFVGVYGAVVLDKGRVSSLDFGSGKDFDYVYADHMPDGQFVSTLRAWGEPIKLSDVIPAIRDERYSADFPTAARSFIDGYEAMFEERPDAVIAVTPVAASHLLSVVGPINVADEPVPVTEANLLELIYKHTQAFDEHGDRKQFVYDLGKALGERVLALPPTRWPAVIQALSHAADERHIQIYFADPRLQGMVLARGWDGGYPPPTDDFLAVVDSNEINGAKANLVTDQTLTYHVEIGADGAAVATLRVGYDNRGTRHLSFSTENMPYLNQPTYEARVRIYAPLGSQRLGLRSGSDPEPEFGRSVFEEYVSVAPETTDALTLTYRLPTSRADSRQIRYDLFVRKQPGTAGVPFHLVVSGPPGWRARGGNDRDWSAETNLAVDRTFSVVFERADGST